MKELTEYRIRMINRLVASAEEFRAACLKAPNPFAPLEGSDWNVQQIAAHLRDTDRLVYGLRARRTAAEENPEFQNFDGEAYMREHDSADEALPVLLNGFVQSIAELAALLRTLPTEAWSRVSRHEKIGTDLTLQHWVERGLAHIEEHLETVSKAQ